MLNVYKAIRNKYSKQKNVWVDSEQVNALNESKNVKHSVAKCGGLWITLMSIFLAAPAVFASDLNMPRGVTPVSEEIYSLHMIIFWICVAIAVVVFSVMIYSIIYHRKSRGAVSHPFHEHTGLEITWAVIPFLILVAMAIPATKVLMNMHDASKSELTIKITGYQWKWHYEYLDQGIKFFSNLSTTPEQIQNHKVKGEHYLLEVDHPLVLPIDKKIRFLVTSSDVIHSWWVPDLGIKRDGVPGFIYEAWAKIKKPGTYRGQCAELCGVNHGFMPIVVQAVSSQQFDAWVAQQKNKTTLGLPVSTAPVALAPLMKEGQVIHEKICAVCHKADGTGVAGVFPAIKGSSVSVGKPISRHIEVVLNGRSGTAMQAFAGQLNDREVAAVVTYQRNAWGNNTGDVVQPSDVTRVRNSK